MQSVEREKKKKEKKGGQDVSYLERPGHRMRQIGWGRTLMLWEK